MDDKRLCIAKLLGALAHHDVEYVLAGSVAVAAWGADIGTPGDLDIIPALDGRNLRRLADALHHLNAVPVPVTGTWERTGEGYSWREFDTNDPSRGVIPDAPDPARPETFDSLFTTRYGPLDVVPVVSGTYKDVATRASLLAVNGVDDVQVLSIEDLLAQLTVPRRKKDATRVAQLRARQLRGK